MAEPRAAREFVERCRKRELDEALILKPGNDREIAV